MVSNRREDHEMSMLALHLLQNCMVYINTLMLQQVLARPQWSERLTARDLRALTPADLGACEPIRPLRTRYGGQVAHRLTPNGPGDTTVESRPGEPAGSFLVCLLMRTETVSNLGGHAARRKGRRALLSVRA